MKEFIDVKLTFSQLKTIIQEAVSEHLAEEDKKTKSRSRKGSSYHASAGSIEALKKHGGSVEKAVKAGAFDWADDPYAAAQAAHIVLTGRTTGEKREE